MTRFRIASVVALWLVAASTTHAASIALQPGAQIVAPGDSVTLDLVASGFGAAVLGDFDVDISFDPAVLTLGIFPLSGALGSIPAFEALDFSLGLTSPGVLNLSVISTLTAAQLDAIQDPSFSLATLHFTVGGIAPGTSTVVGITVNAFGNGSGQPLSIDSLQNATLSAAASGPGPGPGPAPTPVPEPATLILTLGGLAAAARSHRTRSHSGILGSHGSPGLPVRCHRRAAGHTSHPPHCAQSDQRLAGRSRGH